MGHDHGIPKVPNPEQFKVEDVPELMQVRKLLAERGLTNPWLRNEVWRYRSVPFTRKQEIILNSKRGLVVAIPLFILTLAVEKYFGIDYGHHPCPHARDYY